MSKAVCAVYVKFGVFVPGGDGFCEVNTFSYGRKPIVDKQSAYGPQNNDGDSAASQGLPHLGRRKTIAQRHVEACKHGCTGQYEAYEEKNGDAKAESNIHTVYPW